MSDRTVTRARRNLLPGSLITAHSFIVGRTADGRITLSGVPEDALPHIRRAGIVFELNCPVG